MVEFLMVPGATFAIAKNAFYVRNHKWPLKTPVSVCHFCGAGQDVLQ